MTTIERVNIWLEVMAFIDAVTPEDVAWCVRDIPKPEEQDRVHGTIEPAHIKRIYAASVRLRCMGKAERAAAILEHDKDRFKEREAQAYRYIHMGAIAFELAWGAIRDDLALWNGQSMVMRGGWLVVEAPSSPSDGGFFG